MPRLYGTAVVADRHHQMLNGIHSLLSEMFDAVVMVADDRSLLEAIERMRPDLVIIDISLRSSFDDLNIARRIAEGRPDLKVIVLSVHDEAAAVHKAVEAGAAFVLKRSAAADLVPAVHEVLAGRTYISPSVRARA